MGFGLIPLQFTAYQLIPRNKKPEADVTSASGPEPCCSQAGSTRALTSLFRLPPPNLDHVFHQVIEFLTILQLLDEICRHQGGL